MGCVGHGGAARKGVAAKNKTVTTSPAVSIIGCPNAMAQELPLIGNPALRPLMEVHMGQGVIGDLGRMQLTSGSFASCAPIVMFNRGTGMGGLFHLPADALDAQADVLRAMARHVDPTEIRVYGGGHYGQPSFGLADRLQEQLEEAQEGYRRFFSDGFPGANVQAIREGYGRMRVTVDDAGELLVEKGKPRLVHDLASGDPPPGVTLFQRGDWELDEAVELGW